MSELPFTGWECRDCGYATRDEDVQRTHRCYGEDGDTRIEQFLTRWHWRGDRAVVKRELLALIAEQQPRTFTGWRHD